MSRRTLSPPSEPVVGGFSVFTKKGLPRPSPESRLALPHLYKPWIKCKIGIQSLHLTLRFVYGYTLKHRRLPSSLFTSRPFLSSPSLDLSLSLLSFTLYSIVSGRYMERRGKLTLFRFRRAHRRVGESSFLLSGRVRNLHKPPSRVVELYGLDGRRRKGGGTTRGRGKLTSRARDRGFIIVGVYYR